MSLIEEIAKTLGPKGWLTKSDETAPFVRDWLDRYGVPPLGIARPENVEQVAAIVKICQAHNTTIIPQGGKSGLVGASVAFDAKSVILSLLRLNCISEIDPIDFSVKVGAGVILEKLHQELQEHNLQIPMHLGSGGSAQIGGLIATNAGGSHAFKFGMMQELVLGLEVVLPSGKVWQGNRKVLKDNSGFQLRKLFCGSEGRLGIITSATLKLLPSFKSQSTALVALPSIEAALELGKWIRSENWEFITALEFFDEQILNLTLDNIPQLCWPMQSHDAFYLLIEMSSTNGTLNLSQMLEQCLEAAFTKELISDAVIAKSDDQRRKIWQIREELPEGTLREGRQLKHDISIPISQIPAFLNKCAQRVSAILPGVRIWQFGHLGDGNIHYNVSPPKGTNDFGGLEEELSLAVYEIAENCEGSFAAEHGTGRTKNHISDELRSHTERELMKQIHNAIDPNDIMNSGVIV